MRISTVYNNINNGWFLALVFLLWIRRASSFGVGVIQNYYRTVQPQPQQQSSLSTPTTTTTTALACQLLGMNCATPTDFNFSFKGFCKRGGETDVHADGWGVAFYQSECGGIRQFHDDQPASASLLAEFLSDYPIRSLNMMGHIRYATIGHVNLANVHPFSREMWGIQWCFAHNGEVPLFDSSSSSNNTNNEKKKSTPLPTLKSLEDDNDDEEQHHYYYPIGTTDSEATFCAILHALRAKFHTLPSYPILYDAIQQLCQEIVDHDPEGTILNFLLTCGPHTQWVYSWPGSRPGSKVWNGLHYTTRKYPFSTSHLCDMDYMVDFSTCTTEQDCVSVIATKPLTDDEHWCELARGDLILFDRGKPHITPEDLFKVELSGHGLHSTALERPVLEEDMRIYNFDLQHFQGESI
jgi:glutamine amidotransferase